MASNGSLCTAPDFPGRLKAIRDRGGRVVVVDPARTRTAEEADEWVAIRPGTDALLLAAIARELFVTGRADLGDHLRPYVSGMEVLAGALAPFEADAVSAATGVPACGVWPDGDDHRLLRDDGFVARRRAERGDGQS
jgi:anaerobic selenocysteine-containing dehydrogenase